MRKLLAVSFALRLTVAPVSAADLYLIDGTRSEAKFEVRYLYSVATGKMRDISGSINLDPVTPTASSVQFAMRTGSVDTGYALLDQQLHSAFLNAARRDILAASIGTITFSAAVRLGTRLNA